MAEASLRRLVAGFEALNVSRSLSSIPHRPVKLRTIQRCFKTTRTFTTTSKGNDWLRPNKPEVRKSMKGKPRMQTGGSTRGTTVVWGDYGLRMKDKDRRLSAKQLQLGYDTIQKKLRGNNFKLYTRVSANIGVYTKGNEVRMGKGKGNFDYWAARVPVSHVVFELSGTLHEKLVREAFRLAGTKMPGMWEFVKKGDPPVVGITKLGNGVTLESLREARRPVEPQNKELEEENMIIPPSSILGAPQTVSTSTAV